MTDPTKHFEGMFGPGGKLLRQIWLTLLSHIHMNDELGRIIDPRLPPYEALERPGWEIKDVEHGARKIVVEVDATFARGKAELPAPVDFKTFEILPNLVGTVILAHNRATMYHFGIGIYETGRKIFVFRWTERI